MLINKPIVNNDSTKFPRPRIPWPSHDHLAIDILFSLLPNILSLYISFDMLKFSYIKLCLILGKEGR